MLAITLRCRSLILETIASELEPQSLVELAEWLDSNFTDAPFTIFAGLLVTAASKSDYDSEALEGVKDLSDFDQVDGLEFGEELTFLAKATLNFIVSLMPSEERITSEKMDKWTFLSALDDSLVELLEPDTTVKVILTQGQNVGEHIVTRDQCYGFLLGFKLLEAELKTPLPAVTIDSLTVEPKDVSFSDFEYHSEQLEYKLKLVDIEYTFNGTEFLGGLMAACKWLRLDYYKYIDEVYQSRNSQLELLPNPIPMLLQ